MQRKFWSSGGLAENRRRLCFWGAGAFIVFGLLSTASATQADYVSEMSGPSKGSGTRELEGRVEVYRKTLNETTRKRVPLEWAATQVNLGNALAALGERENGTSKFDEATTAFREALKE